MSWSNKKEAPKGFTNIHGKMYKQVVLRVNEFRTSKNFAGFGIDTSIKDFGFQTGFVIVEAKITDPKGRIVGSGLAEEKRGSSNINKFSALENCETSAIGRALSSIGLGGEEYCSANELELALDKQENDKKNKQTSPPNIKVVPDPRASFKEAFSTAISKVGEKRVLMMCGVSVKQDQNGKFSEGLAEIAGLDDLQLSRIADDLLTLKT